MKYRHKLWQTLVVSLFALYQTRFVPTVNLSQKQFEALKRACGASDG